MTDKKTKEQIQEAPRTIRLYRQVKAWWTVYNKDGHWKLNQAINLGLAKFMGKSDKEITDLYNEMRGRDDSNTGE